jgi:hypothetical protein
MVEILHGLHEGRLGQLIRSYEEKDSFGVWAYVDVEILIKGVKKVVKLLAGSIRSVSLPSSQPRMVRQYNESGALSFRYGITSLEQIELILEPVRA